MTACSFDPGGLPSQPPADASTAADGNPQADGSGPDAVVVDASGQDAPISDAGPPDAPLPPCATDPAYAPNPLTARRYRYYDTTRTWTQAVGDCEADGAHLVVIDDQDENTYVASLMSNSAWIGLNDRDDENNWFWVTGAPVTYTAWEAGEPNNAGAGWGDPGEDCVEIRTGAGAWNDENCGEVRRVVCECDPDLPLAQARF